MLNLGPYSTKEFPNIRVYPTIIDRILEGVAVLLAIAAWVCAIWVYIHIEGHCPKFCVNGNRIQL